MILDLEKDALPSEAVYDVCIVGAGAAGITLAVQLSRAGLSVLMLESGARADEDRSTALLDVANTGRRHTGATGGRRRVLGGATTAWGGSVVPLDEMDFEKRYWVPESGWPIDRDELTPFYERALVLEGLGDCIQADDDVWKAARHDPGEVGPDFERSMSRWLPHPNFAQIYGAELDASATLAVVLHANVVRMDIDGGSGRIVGLTCRGHDGRETIAIAERYVFTMGGIETVRLLLQPAGGVDVAPWVVSGYVGRHFQEHLGCTLGRIKPGHYADLSNFFDNFYRNGVKYQPRIKLSRQMQQDFQILNSVAYLVPQSSSGEAMAAAKRTFRAVRGGQLQALSASDIGAALGGSISQIKAAIRLAKHGRAYNPGDLGIDVDVASEQSPAGGSSITLSDDVDALGMHRASVDWRIERFELDSLEKTGRGLVKLFKARGWPEITLDTDLQKNQEAFADKIFDTYHHMGGARMSHSASTGVVDADLRLHGTPNGYVCSAAVFPTSGFSGPTHTVIALGARLSDHLIAMTSRARSQTLVAEAAQ